MGTSKVVEVDFGGDWNQLELAIREIVEHHGGEVHLGVLGILASGALANFNKLFSPHVEVLLVEPLFGETGGRRLVFRKAVR